MVRIFQNYTQVAAAQSTRHGGVSPAPYHSLNLGKSTADDPANTAENLRRFCQNLGFTPQEMAWSHQVHGSEVLTATGPVRANGYDALVTNQPGLLLAVSVADCVPILVYDPQNQAVAAIHAGWRGTVAGIVEKTIRQMAVEFGTEGRDCAAYVGTCISAAEYEVGEEVAAEFAPQFKHWDATRGKFRVDLKAANAAQLLAVGVPETRVEVSPFCTVQHNADYFSHRADGGVTGRMLAAIGLRK